MKRMMCMVLTMVSGFCFANDFYYGEPARLEGKVQIIKSLHPNQEAFGGNQIAIALNHAISVDGDDWLVKTKLIQLVDANNTRYNQYFKSNYKEIIVDCRELFRGHTGHHTTKILCVVESIKYKWEEMEALLPFHNKIAKRKLRALTTFITVSKLRLISPDRTVKYD